MKTTMLIVEYLIGGTLVLLALAFFVVSVFPGAVKANPDGTQVLLGLKIDLDQSLPWPVLLLLSTLFVGIAYAVGVLSEPIAREIFEDDLDEIKRRRLKEFLKKNPNLEESPVLKNPATQTYGYVRFYVLMKSPGLYQDIASHLDRFRLLRIMFLAVFISYVGTLIRLPREFTTSWICFLTVLAVIAYIITRVIYDRFERYCRSVERSYYVLMLD